MTPIQLKKASTKDLLIAYKHKARCFHCKCKSKSIYNEIESRLGKGKLQKLRTETFHLENGEGDAMFNFEIDKLINSNLE